MPDNDAGYRQKLIDAEYDLGIGYTKTLTFLSSGALGLSITFAKDIVGPTPICGTYWLKASWVLFTISLILVLASYKAGQVAYSNAREQLDANAGSGEIPGGKFTKLLTGLNFATGASFCFGVIALVVFIFRNV